MKAEPLRMRPSTRLGVTTARAGVEHLAMHRDRAVPMVALGQHLCDRHISVNPYAVAAGAGGSWRRGGPRRAQRPRHPELSFAAATRASR